MKFVFPVGSRVWRLTGGLMGFAGCGSLGQGWAIKCCIFSTRGKGWNGFFSWQFGFEWRVRPSRDTHFLTTWFSGPRLGHELFVIRPLGSLGWKVWPGVWFFCRARSQYRPACTVCWTNGQVAVNAGLHLNEVTDITHLSQLSGCCFEILSCWAGGGVFLFVAPRLTWAWWFWTAVEKSSLFDFYRWQLSFYMSWTFRFSKLDLGTLIIFLIWRRQPKKVSV